MINHQKKLFLTMYLMACSMQEVSRKTLSSRRLVQSVWCWYRQWQLLLLQSIRFYSSLLSSLCFICKWFIITYTDNYLWPRGAGYVFSTYRTTQFLQMGTSTASSFYSFYSSSDAFSQFWTTLVPASSTSGTAATLAGSGVGSASTSGAGSISSIKGLSPCVRSVLFTIFLGFRGQRINLRSMSKSFCFLMMLRGSLLINTSFFLIFFSSKLIYSWLVFVFCDSYGAKLLLGQFFFLASIHFRISYLLSNTGSFLFTITFLLQYTSSSSLSDSLDMYDLEDALSLSYYLLNSLQGCHSFFVPLSPTSLGYFFDSFLTGFLGLKASVDASSLRYLMRCYCWRQLPSENLIQF